MLGQILNSNFYIKNSILPFSPQKLKLKAFISVQIISSTLAAQTCDANTLRTIAAKWSSVNFMARLLTAMLL